MAKVFEEFKALDDFIKAEMVCDVLPKETEHYWIQQVTTIAIRSAFGQSLNPDEQNLMDQFISAAKRMNVQSSQTDCAYFFRIIDNLFKDIDECRESLLKSLEEASTMGSFFQRRYWHKNLEVLVQHRSEQAKERKPEVDFDVLKKALIKKESKNGFIADVAIALGIVDKKKERSEVVRQVRKALQRK